MIVERKGLFQGRRFVTEYFSEKFALKRESLHPTVNPGWGLKPLIPWWQQTSEAANEMVESRWKPKLIWSNPDFHVFLPN